MTENTEAKNDAPKAPKTKKTKLPAQAEAAVAEMKKGLPSPGTKLGLLARRVEAALCDLHEAAGAYGQTAILGNVLGREHRIPISTRIDVVLTVCADDSAGQTYQFALGDVPMMPGRPEKTFDEFATSVTVDPVAIVADAVAQRTVFKGNPPV